MIESHTLSHLLRHAERHGTEQVWETAVQLHLPAVSLMRLADRLTILDSKWRLPAASKPALARELLEMGWSRTRIAREIGASMASVTEWTEESPGHAETQSANPHG